MSESRKEMKEFLKLNRFEKNMPAKSSMNAINKIPCSIPTTLTDSGFSKKYLRGMAMNNKIK